MSPLAAKRTAGELLVGTGSALPGRDLPGARLDNVRLAELSGRLQDTLARANSGERLRALDGDFAWTRAGIRERRILDRDHDVRDLAEVAARSAVASCGTEAIEIVVVSTTAPRASLPSIACVLQERLGLGGGCLAFDLVLGCAGFVAALDVARGLLVRCRPGARALVVAAEAMSRILNAADHNTAAICGDGAGAVVLQRPRRYEPPASVHQTLGRLAGAIAIRPVAALGPVFRWSAQGSRTTCEPDLESRMALHMDGRTVFREMVRAVPNAVLRWHAMDRAGSQPLGPLLLHQANARMLESIGGTLRPEVPFRGAPSNIERVGNTSSASIPILLDELARSNRLGTAAPLLAGFGAGCAIHVTRGPLPAM